MIIFVSTFHPFTEEQSLINFGCQAEAVVAKGGDPR